VKSQLNHFFYRFGPFELEASSGELRKHGRPIKLPPQPGKVLSLLVEHPGDVVSREEVQRQIWGDGTFVDFEHALNVCIRQLRETLNDDAKTPRYIETLPRVGYRFIAPVEQAELNELGGDAGQAAAIAGQATSGHRLALTYRAPSLKLLLQVGAACLVLTGLFAAGYVRGKRNAGFVPPSFHRLTFERGIIYSARFAPDGQVVYDASWDNKPSRIFTTHAGILQPMPLELSSAHLLDISPTGELALTLNGYPEAYPVFLRGTLARAPMAGSAPRQLLDDVRFADFDSKGELAVVHHSNARSRLEYPIGRILYETAGWISHIRFSPRNDRIAFIDHPIWADDQGAIVVMDVRGQKKVLSTGWESAMGLAWAPSGSEIWFTAAKFGVRRDLFAVDLEGRYRTLLRVPGGITLHDISPDGRALLTVDNERTGTTAITPGGEHDLSWLDITFPLGISPDGRQILLEEQSDQTGSDYWVGLRSIDGSAPTRLGEGWGGGFSPDGRWTATDVNSIPESTFLLPTGAGERKELKHPGIRSYGYRVWFTPDGKGVVIGGIEPGHSPRSYMQNLNDGATRPITPEGMLGRLPSPDGRYLVGLKEDQSHALYDIQRGESREIPGTTWQLWPAGWSSDSRYLYLYTRTSPPSQIWRLKIDSAEKKVVKQLTPNDSAGILEIFHVLMTRDEKTFVYAYDRYLSELYIVDGLH